jgi:L-histidine N-alpha-methyltransferase
MNPEDRFLLGLDMLKSPDFIAAAYNDRQGVTAAFNKNILANLNRSFNADFNMADFEHQAIFINDKEQVLRATREIRTRIADLNLSVSCHKGETIRTEICKN